MKNTYIYALCDPSSGRVRYVGKSNDPRSRLRGHIHDSKKKDYPVHRWIRKLERSDQLPTLVILSIVSDNDWKNEERRWIDHFATMYSDLLNIAPGGEGPSDFRHIERGEQRYNSKLDENTVVQMRTERANGATVQDLADKYDINVSTVGRICTGDAWTHAGGTITHRTSKPPKMSGEQHFQSKLTWDIVRKIRYKYANGSSQNELARQYNVTQANIWMIVHLRTWKEE